MEKEGKIDFKITLIASVVIFVVYAVFVFGFPGIDTPFPENETNASASFGYSPSGLNASFNGTNPQFHAIVTANATTGNVTNVSLYISTSEGTVDSSTKNQTLNTTTGPGETETIIFNTTAFDEGTYFWFFEIWGNETLGIGSNTTNNRSFTIDKTVPGFSNIDNKSVVNTSNSAVATEDTVYVVLNATDALTSIHTVRLFVNTTGSANNEVNITTDGTKGAGNAGNGTVVNLSFKIPGDVIGQFLNFTFQVNDSVNNVNITSAVVFLVESDGTVPGPITLNGPIDLFNTTATSVDFNFTANDNNDTLLTAEINVTLNDGEAFTNLTSISVNNGTAQVNSSNRALSNGTYKWNVTVTDGPGNANTSLTRSFTVDQIPPVFDYYNFTNQSLDHNGSVFNNTDAAVELTTATGISQGSKFFGIANWTDNLTNVVQGVLQAYNTSSATWVTLNQSVNETGGFIASHHAGWTNFTFTPSTGHNLFEGKNVSFRIYANDSLRNKNDSDSVKNFTIQVNDNTAPELLVSSVAGGSATNGTNTSDNTPTVVWNVTERTALSYIAVQFNSLTDTNCNQFRNFTTTANANRNGSLTLLDTSGCAGLSNGTNTIRLTAADTAGNTDLYIHSFTVETGTPTITLSSLENALSAVNKSNVTVNTGINFTATNGGAGALETFTWTSSCNSTTQTTASSVSTFPAANLSHIYPFQNISACANNLANRTVTVSATDTAGNTQSAHYQFQVDGVGPVLTVTSPTNGQSFGANLTINLSAQDDSQKIGAFGYFLDGGIQTGTFNSLNLSASIGNTAVNTTNVFRINFTAGTHTIKFTVNDTLGNVRNSSVFTITQIAGIRPNEINSSMTTYITSLLGVPANVTVRLKGAGGDYQEIGSANETDNNRTFEIVLTLNSSDTNSINLSLTEINGSAANWDRINISVFINESKLEAGIENNWTNTILTPVFVNDSVGDFITDNNSYFGVVVLPINISSNASNLNTSADGVELWWLPDSANLQSRQNISQCTSGFGPTTTTPCWNYTSGGKTIVSVPHFSIVVAVNDTDAPTVNVTIPGNFSNVTVGLFVTNITVSEDAVSCKYIVNGSTSNETMTKSGNICLGSLERFKNFNGDSGNDYNINFSVTDSSGNEEIYVLDFNVSDNTAPDSGTSISAGSITSTTATITISGVNESVNATVLYGTSNTSLGSIANQASFNSTPKVSLSGLTAGTTYFYNVTLFDFNGNVKRNGTFTFATSAAASTSTTTSSGSGGGGGGGSVPPSTVSASKAQVWQSVPAGSSFSLDIDDAEIGVTSVKVEGIKSELNSVELSVAALTQNPVSSEPSSAVFQYLRITKRNLQDTDADSFKVGFRVTKAWLDDNGLVSGDIALYRFADSAWNELTTRVAGTDATYVNYEADTPGFSSFAIAVKSGVTPTEAPEELPEEAPEGDDEAPEEIDTPVPVQGPGQAPTAWIIAAIVIILGIILIVVYQKKKQQG